jgi:hypothetical protein
MKVVLSQIKEKKDDDWNDKENNQTEEREWTTRILSES